MPSAYSPIRSADKAPELAQALGDMMLAWMLAERELTTAFAVMLGCPHYKASRMYQKLPNYRSRTQALYALIEIHPEFEVLREPIAKLSSLSKTRNDWVHGAFITGWNETSFWCSTWTKARAAPTDAKTSSRPTSQTTLTQLGNAQINFVRL